MMTPGALDVRRGTSQSPGAVPEEVLKPTLVPAIDPAALENIRMLDRPGKPDLLAAILAMYLETTPDEVAAIGAAVETGDLVDVNRRGT